MDICYDYCAFCVSFAIEEMQDTGNIMGNNVDVDLCVRYSSHKDRNAVVR